MLPAISTPLPSLWTGNCMHTARRAWPCGPVADPALWGGAAEGVGYEVPGVEGGGGGRTAFRERAQTNLWLGSRKAPANSEMFSQVYSNTQGQYTEALLPARLCGMIITKYWCVTLVLTSIFELESIGGKGKDPTSQPGFDSALWSL